MPFCPKFSDCDSILLLTEWIKKQVFGERLFLAIPIFNKVGVNTDSLLFIGMNFVKSVLDFIRKLAEDDENFAN